MNYWRRRWWSPSKIRETFGIHCRRIRVRREKKKRSAVGSERRGHILRARIETARQRQQPFTCRDLFALDRRPNACTRRRRVGRKNEINGRGQTKSEKYSTIRVFRLLPNASPKRFPETLSLGRPIRRLRGVCFAVHGCLYARVSPKGAIDIATGHTGVRTRVVSRPSDDVERSAVGRGSSSSV